MAALQVMRKFYKVKTLTLKSDVTDTFKPPLESVATHSGRANPATYRKRGGDGLAGAERGKRSDT